jgi:hypothetical protein
MRKPIRLKRNSPCDARATPDEIMKTMTASLRLGSWIRVVHEMRRIATGVNAYANGLNQEMIAAEGKRGHYLEHLYVGHTEIEVGGVAQDETSTEEKSYGENGAHKHVFRKVHLLRSIKEMRRPFQYARADCL